MVALYKAVAYRARAKTCCKCGRMGVAHEGDYVWATGDMSQAKVFRCFYCKERGL